MSNKMVDGKSLDFRVTAREATYAYRLNQWTQIICQCRSSSQTIKAWCQENDVDPKKYYYWLKRVHEAAASPQAVAAISCGTLSVQLSNEASYQMIENILKAMQRVR